MADLTDRLIAMGHDPHSVPPGGELDLTQPPPPRVVVHTVRGYGKATEVKSKKSTLDSALEEKFLNLWSVYGDHRFKIYAGYYYKPGTKWHCDFAFPEQRVLVEIDGKYGKNGSPGGHRTVGGWERDKEHDFWAACNGWQMMRLSPDMLTKQKVLELSELLEGKDGRTKVG